MPTSRTVEILESTPGLIANSHSAEGKAPQYFLRGFQLDHGTDFLIIVDGMPVNLRTNAHAQAYGDINFLIPELISTMDTRKGPYFADTGDFSSAGSARIALKDKLDKGFADVTLGSFGYQRYVAAKSFPTLNGDGNLLIAGAFNRYNGPWDIPDSMKKLNGAIRYSQGTADDGFSITGMAYDNTWHATNVIPQRAVDEGLISRFGTIDPTDGASSSRYSISSRFANLNDTGVSHLDASCGPLFIDDVEQLHVFLDDPVRGDQFRQTDDRAIFGGHASHTFKRTPGSVPIPTLSSAFRASMTIYGGSACSGRRNAWITSPCLMARPGKQTSVLTSRTPPNGPLGCAPSSASATTITGARWRATGLRIPASHMPQSPVRRPRWW
jgi:hypothetical protein